MGSQTAAGTRIYIGGTGDIASEAAWVEIGEVVNPGTFGRVYQNITHNPIGTRDTEKFKGSRNDGTMTLQLGQDMADAGQDALLDALDSDDAYNIKVEQNDADTSVSPPGDPTTHTLKARVMSFEHDFSGGVDSIVGASVGLEVITGTLTTTAAT